MSRGKIFLITGIIVITTGCIGKVRENDKPEVFIPQKDMEEILHDLYIADGLLNNPRIYNEYKIKDSVENYIDVIESNGYTKPQFDENLNYYFLNKPKKIQAIYDNILTELTREESSIIHERKQNNKINSNLWTGKRSFNLPDDGVDNTVEFDVPIEGPGVYSITARIMLYDDDQSIDPRTVVWFWKDNETEKGEMIPWDTLILKKTGRPHNLNLSDTLTDSTFTRLRGKFLDHTPQPGHWEKHSQVTNIVIVYRGQQAEK